MHSFDWAFNESSGGATVDPSLAPHLFPVAIAGRGYLIDTGSRRFRRYSRPPQRVQTDTSSRPGEQTQSNEDLWPRAQQSFHLGAGQSSMELETASPYRFWDSQGVDVWTKTELSLLKDTGLIRASAEPNLAALTTGTHLAIVDGSNVRFYDGATWTVAALGGVASVAASDGVSIYASAAGAIKKITTGLAVSDAWTLGSATTLGFAKGRLLAGVGPVLSDLVPTLSPVTVMTHPNSAWTWTAVTEGPSAIYAAGKAGSTSLIYRVPLKSDGTGLDAPVVAAPLPDGETVTALSSYLGFIIVGTTKGVRFAVPDSVGDLNLGSPIPTNGPVYALEAQESYVWFGMTNYSSALTGLGRMDLSAFPTPLTPAYASDLMRAGQGTVTSALTWGDKRYFTVVGDGLVAESDSYLSGGWIDLSTTDFGITDSKVAQIVDVKHDPLEGAIEVWLDRDGRGFEPVAISSTTGATSAKLLLSNQEGERFTMRLVIQKGNLPPVLRRVRLRAHPLPERVSVFELPVVISETLDLGFEAHRNTTEDANYLIDLVNSGRAISLQYGRRGYVVYPSDYEWLPSKQTEDHAGWQGTLVIQLKEVTDG